MDFLHFFGMVASCEKYFLMELLVTPSEWKNYPALGDPFSHIMVKVPMEAYVDFMKEAPCVYIIKIIDSETQALIHKYYSIEFNFTWVQLKNQFYVIISPKIGGI